MIATLTYWQWAIVALSAFIVGVSKTGLPGAGILAIPLLAAVLPARASTGFVLPLLICADLFAVAYYRRKASWGHLTMLLPWASLGVVAGFLIMRRIDDHQLQPLIGIVILAMLALNAWRRRQADPGTPLAGHRGLAAVVGLLAGVTTMLANAAGPIMMIYLLSMGLPKQVFIGTAAWYFFILNWFKVPFSAGLGLITVESLTLNAIALPAIALGALFGVVLLRRMPQQWFGMIVEILAAAAAIKLIF